MGVALVEPVGQSGGEESLSVFCCLLAVSHRIPMGESWSFHIVPQGTRANSRNSMLGLRDKVHSNGEQKKKQKTFPKAHVRPRRPASHPLDAIVLIFLGTS